MNIIGIINQKGGTLKTSITTNLAGVYSKQGKKVLIVDMDPQSNLAGSFGINPDPFENTIYDVLLNGVPPQDIIVNTAPNMDLLLSGDDMAFFPMDAASKPNSYMLLDSALRQLTGRYDVALIDSPPTLSLIQGNILAAATDIIIPFQPEAYSMRSLIKSLAAVKDIQNEYNPFLNILGILPTLVDSRTVLHADILEQTRQFCKNENLYLFRNWITKSIKYADYIAYEKKPITLSDSKQHATQAGVYYDIKKEIEAIWHAKTRA